MIILQEIGQRQLQTAVLRKTGHTGNQPCCVAIGGPNVVQNILSRLLFQLDITALGSRYKSVFDLSGHAAGSVGQQCCKLIFKVVPLICLTNKVQHRQALFVLCQPQTTAQLLQENGQGLGGAQEQHRIDLGNIYTFVIDIHDKDKADISSNQPIFGGFSFFIGRFSDQEDRRNSMVIEIPAHELGMVNRNAESQPFDLVYVRHILQQRRNHQICTAIRYCSAEGI